MPRLLIAEARAIDVRRIGMPLPRGAEAAVYVAPIVGEAIALGRFQRVRSTLDLPRLEGSGLSLVRRKSGGGALRVGRGQIYVSLELASPSALGGVSDPGRALNRHVRPLLRALTSLSNITVTSGGREVILAKGHPVGWVGVHHERSTGATGLEAILNLSRTFELESTVDLSHGSIEPRFPPSKSLDEVFGRTVTAEEVVNAIVSELAALAAGDTGRFEPAAPIGRVDPEEAPFTAMIEESIGLIGAVVERDRVAIGGDLMASHDVVEALGREVLSITADDALGDAIDRHFADAMLLGVRSLESIRKVIRAARSAAA